jgi:site-specific recombinase XerD
MTRKRAASSDNWLPSRVYRGRKSYEFHPKGGGSIVLCARPADGIETELIKSCVWAAYKKIVSEPIKPDDMSRLIEAFHKSAQYRQLAVNTQRDYLQYSKRIIRVFGHMEPGDIKAPHIRQFMDAMNEQNKPVAANRHHSYLSVLFGWGIAYSYCTENPAKQVRKFREEARDRYIEDWEYDLVLNIARQSSYPYIAPMMELAYLCRARSIEVLAFTEANISEEGIFLNRAKGSNNEITAWSERLHKAVAEARALFPNAPASIKRPLIHSKTGMAIPRESFKTAWQRVIAQALRSGLTERFTYHDVKAKAVTDHAKHFAGHKTKKMEAVYNRKPDIIAPTR